MVVNLHFLNGKFYFSVLKFKNYKKSFSLFHFILFHFSILCMSGQEWPRGPEPYFSFFLILFLLALPRLFVMEISMKH